MQSLVDALPMIVAAAVIVGAIAVWAVLRMVRMAVRLVLVLIPVLLVVAAAFYGQ